MLKLFSFRIFLVFVISSFFLSLSTFAMGGIGGRPEHPLDKENPDWFIYKLKPGESYSDTLVITNNSDKEWIIDIYPADSVKSSGGGFALKQRKEKMVEMGSWVTLKQNKVQLKPYESAKIGFDIHIPKNIDVGEYTGAILFEKRTPENETKKGGVKINVRTGVRIYETVPGKIQESLQFQKFEIEQNSEGIKFAHSEILNTGNVSSKAQYITTISKGGETEEKKSEFLLERNATFENNINIGHDPYFGNVEIVTKVLLHKRDGTQSLVGEKKISYFVIPWLHVGILLLIILIIVALIIRQKMKYSGKGWVSVKAKEGDTLMSLAKECNIDWNFVAKVNKIKAPFMISTGDTLLLPSIPPSHATHQVKNTKRPSALERHPDTSCWKKFTINKEVSLKDIVHEIHHDDDFEDIAKVNKISEPYIIQSGTVILLPPTS